MARQRVQEHPLGVKTWYSLKWSCKREKERQKDGGRVGETERARFMSVCYAVRVRVCVCVYVCVYARMLHERKKASV